MICKVSQAFPCLQLKHLPRRHQRSNFFHKVFSCIFKKESQKAAASFISIFQWFWGGDILSHCYSTWWVLIPKCSVLRIRVPWFAVRLVKWASCSQSMPKRWPLIDNMIPAFTVHICQTWAGWKDPWFNWSGSISEMKTSLQPHDHKNGTRWTDFSHRAGVGDTHSSGKHITIAK